MAPLLHAVERLHQQLTLIERPLLSPVSGALVMFPTIIDPNTIRKELRGGLVPSEEMGHNLSKMNAIGTG
jgi:hypothetical protein